jgi:hypothetical protein
VCSLQAPFEGVQPVVQQHPQRATAAAATAAAQRSSSGSSSTAAAAATAAAQQQKVLAPRAAQPHRTCPCQQHAPKRAMHRTMPPMTQATPPPRALLLRGSATVCGWGGSEGMRRTGGWKRGARVGVAGASGAPEWSAATADDRVPVTWTEGCTGHQQMHEGCTGHQQMHEQSQHQLHHTPHVTLHHTARVTRASSHPHQPYSHHPLAS